MAELIYGGTKIDAGERFFLVHVGRAHTSGAILADLEMNEIGPVAVQKLVPRRFSGFELPANDVMNFAQARAYEMDVDKILVVDPHGQLLFAARSRYGGR